MIFRQDAFDVDMPFPPPPHAHACMHHAHTNAIISMSLGQFVFINEFLVVMSL